MRGASAKGCTGTITGTTVEIEGPSDANHYVFDFIALTAAHLERSPTNWTTACCWRRATP